MALFGACQKWGTFLWGDGTQYCNRTFFIDKYVAQVDDVLSEPVHRVSITLNYSGGALFSVFSISPLMANTAYDIHHNSAHVDRDFLDKISIVVNHSNGTLFKLDSIRPHLKVHKRRLIS